MAAKYDTYVSDVGGPGGVGDVGSEAGSFVGGFCDGNIDVVVSEDELMSRYDSGSSGGGKRGASDLLLLNSLS
jgi:hypothetical protein